MLAARKRFIHIYSKNFSMSDSFDRIFQTCIRFKGSLAILFLLLVELKLADNCPTCYADLSYKGRLLGPSSTLLEKRVRQLTC